jgi:ubiquinone/menaquinone biosynthesis C-methylase UbiE
MNNEKRGYIPEEIKEGKVDIVEDYIEQLDLSSEDLKKKILDIGSGGKTRFAKEVGERGLGSQIYSIDRNPHNQGNMNFVQGRAEHLPFKDGEFELVISNAAFPFFVILDPEINKQLQAGNTTPAENGIRQVLYEMLRVLQDNGDIKLGRVCRNNDIPHQKVLEVAFDKVLHELVENKIVTFEEKPKGPLLAYKDMTKKMADLYLIHLHKLK